MDACIHVLGGCGSLRHEKECEEAEAGREITRILKRQGDAEKGDGKFI